MNIILCVNVNIYNQIETIWLVNFNKKNVHGHIEKLIDFYYETNNFENLNLDDDHFTYIFKIKNEKQYEKFLQTSLLSFKNKDIKNFIKEFNLYEWLL